MTNVGFLAKIATYKNSRDVLFKAKGPFKYYVIKEVGGWGQKMAMFDDLQYCTGWVGLKKSKT